MIQIELVQEEMAAGVVALGGGAEVSAKVANARAARATGLPIGMIERLRWRKVKLVPAYVADSVRGALHRYTHRLEAAARHEAELARVHDAFDSRVLDSEDRNCGGHAALRTGHKAPSVPRRAVALAPQPARGVNP